MTNLCWKKIAILVADGFEQVELTGRARRSTRPVRIPAFFLWRPGNVRAWKFVEWGEEFPVDIIVERVDPAAFDALLLPGGVMNPDLLRNGVRPAFLRRE